MGLSCSLIQMGGTWVKKKEKVTDPFSLLLFKLTVQISSKLSWTCEGLCCSSSFFLDKRKFSLLCATTAFCVEHNFIFLEHIKVSVLSRMLFIQAALDSSRQFFCLFVCLRHSLNVDFGDSTLKILICIHSPLVIFLMLLLFEGRGSLPWSFSFIISWDYIYFKYNKQSLSLAPAWHYSLPLLSYSQQVMLWSTLCHKIHSAQPSVTWHMAKMGFVHINLNSVAHPGGGRGEC